MFKSFCRVLSAAVVMCFISCEPETKVEYVPVIQPESSGLFLMSVVFNTEELTAENVEVTISITREDIVKAGYVYTPQRTDWLNAREILNSESFVELIKNKNGKYVFSAAENGYYSIAAKDKDGYDIYRQEFVSNIDKIAPKEVYGLNAVYDSALQLINVSWKNLEPNDVDHCLVTCTKAGEVIETDVIIKGETYTLNNVRYDERYDYEFIVRAVDKAGNLTDGETSGVASLSHDSYTEIEGRMFEIVTFGSFPQTIKAADVTVDESVTKTAGMYTYYKGSDGEWYAKTVENAYESGYAYSDGTLVVQGGTSEKYFKVEPVKWRVLTLNYNEAGKKLLLAESELINCVFYDYSNVNRMINNSVVYPNNYEYSRVRAYLNGLSYQLKSSNNESQTSYDLFKDKGFLQTAFTEKERSFILQTMLDNSARSTNTDSNAAQWSNGENIYACRNTTDRIFLLSEQEVTKNDYGFDVYNADIGDGIHTKSSRIRITTDFAKANGAWQFKKSGYGGCCCCLRSPCYYDSSIVRDVTEGGRTNTLLVNYASGVVPALCVD